MIEFDEKGITVNGQHISYDTIDDGRNKLRFANSVLVRLGVSYGRSNYFTDHFIMEKEKWEEKKRKLKLHGELYLGELAGKHSEVTYNINRDEVEEETDLEKIGNFYKVSGWGSWDMDIGNRIEEDFDPEAHEEDEEEPED